MPRSLSLRLLRLFFLLGMFIAVLPVRSLAAYKMPVSAPAAQGRSATHHFLWPRGTHFRGRGHRLVAVLALVCSILGSAAVVASFAAVFAASPAGVFVACAYGFNILGIVLGFCKPDDPTANTAVVLGCVNLLVLLVGGAIYAAAKGDFSKLFNLAYWSTR
jgi:hypothetical protein